MLLPVLTRTLRHDAEPPTSHTRTPDIRGTQERAAKEAKFLEDLRKKRGVNEAKPTDPKTDSASHSAPEQLASCFSCGKPPGEGEFCVHCGTNQVQKPPTSWVVPGAAAASPVMQLLSKQPWTPSGAAGKKRIVKSPGAGGWREHIRKAQEEKVRNSRSQSVPNSPNSPPSASKVCSPRSASDARGLAPALAESKDDEAVKDRLKREKSERKAARAWQRVKAKRAEKIDLAADKGGEDASATTREGGTAPVAVETSAPDTPRAPKASADVPEVSAQPAQPVAANQINGPSDEVISGDSNGDSPPPPQHVESQKWLDSDSESDDHGRGKGEVNSIPVVQLTLASPKRPGLGERRDSKVFKTGLQRFNTEQRKVLRQEHPTMNLTQVGAELKRRWGLLSDTEKTEWNEKAATAATSPLATSPTKSAQGWSKIKSSVGKLGSSGKTMSLKDMAKLKSTNPAQTMRKKGGGASGGLSAAPQLPDDGAVEGLLEEEVPREF